METRHQLMHDVMVDLAYLSMVSLSLLPSPLTGSSKIVAQTSQCPKSIFTALCYQQNNGKPLTEKDTYSCTCFQIISYVMSSSLSYSYVEGASVDHMIATNRYQHNCELYKSDYYRTAYLPNMHSATLMMKPALNLYKLLLLQSRPQDYIDCCKRVMTLDSMIDIRYHMIGEIKLFILDNTKFKISCQKVVIANWSCTWLYRISQQTKQFRLCKHLV